MCGCNFCVCACMGAHVRLLVGFDSSAQQKMEPHGLYRPPSEERLSPGQQPPSPCVKGSQRVVTLAQHISVSSLSHCIINGKNSTVTNNQILMLMFMFPEWVYSAEQWMYFILKQEVITKDYTRQSQQQSYHGSPVLDLTRPPSASQPPPASQESGQGPRYLEGLGGERNRDR